MHRGVRRDLLLGLRRPSFEELAPILDDGYPGMFPVYQEPHSRWAIYLNVVVFIMSAVLFTAALLTSSSDLSDME